MSTSFSVTRFLGKRAGGFWWCQTVISIRNGEWESGFGNPPRAIEVVSWGSGRAPVKVMTYGGRRAFHAVAETISRRETKISEGYVGSEATERFEDARGFLSWLDGNAEGGQRDAILPALDWVVGDALSEHDACLARQKSVDAFLASL